MRRLLVSGLLGWCLMLTVSACDPAFDPLGLRSKAADGSQGPEDPCFDLYESEASGKVYFYLGGNKVIVERQEPDLPLDQLRARARQADYFPCEHIFYADDRGYYYYDRQGKPISLDPLPSSEDPAAGTFPLAPHPSSAPATGVVGGVGG